MPSRRGKDIRADKPETASFTIVNLKGSAEYRDWMMAIHKKTHLPLATIARLALACWAKEQGHPSPPLDI